MSSRKLMRHLPGASILFLAIVQLAFAQVEDVDFSDAYEHVYQIRMVSQDAGGKSAIGSGFQVTVVRLIVTNYHVVSDVVTAPDRGQTAYALGNPGDWGIVMVPGPTNGLVEHSYEDRVLFSGSLNPGMSGGPSLRRHLFQWRSRLSSNECIGAGTRGLIDSWCGFYRCGWREGMNFQSCT